MPILIKLFKLAESQLKYCNSIVSVRSYARWSHRQPRRVLTSEQYDEIEENRHGLEQNTANIIKELPERDTDLNVKLHSKWVPKNVKVMEPPLIQMEDLDKHSESIQFKIEPKVTNKKKRITCKAKEVFSKNKKQIDMLETVIDANGELVYTKLPDNDPVVGQLLITVKSRNVQVKKDVALLEGKRLIKDALQANCVLKTLIFSRKNDIDYLKPYLPKTGAKLYKMPYKEIRLWSDLVTTPGIMGIFKTPSVETFQVKNGLPITVICDNVREPGNLGAILRTAAGVGAQNVILTKGCVDLWDTKALRGGCGAHFRLQMQTKMKWFDIEKHINDLNATVFIADNKIVRPNVNENGEELELNQEQLQQPQQEQEKTSLTDILTAMPLLPYYAIQFDNMNHLVLIVGGETEGISEESFRIAANFNGVRVNIPLTNDIDSLNTGTALGVILFEMKRQLLLAQACKNARSAMKD